MIKIIDIEHCDEWDGIVCSFPNYDVYYLSGYVKAFEVHGDGEPFLLYYEGNGLRAIYVYMKRTTDIVGIFDSITPYGYGGVLLDGEDDEDNRGVFWKEFCNKMKEEHIVDNFVRYHPMLENSVKMKGVSNVIDLGNTIAMDLSSEEVIWTNIHSKNRNMIRKAEKNGIVIHHGKGLDLLMEFKEIYNATMVHDNAEEYYYFEDAFYESIDRDLNNHYEVFWAELDGKKIAMSIMIFANGWLNYHLSGSVFEFRNLAPSNLLLYKAALWGCEQGMRYMHLGGGVGSGEDNLFKFKAGFNRNSEGHQFSIGKEIYDQKMYDELVGIREERDKDFDKESRFFPLYRC